MLAPPRQDAAALAATTTLLNCFLREGGAATFADGRAVFPELGVEAELLYRSATLHHRFGPPSVSPTELARRISERLDPGTSPQTLLDRVEASLECVRTYVEARTPDLDRLFSAEPLSFIETDQALVLGHPLHPTPKGLTGSLAPYAPELQPQFPLHWLSVDHALVAHDSAAGTPAPRIAEQLLGRPAPDGRILLPAHPWEAGFLARSAATLFASGAVVDLGPDGAPVTPTSSVRTVYNADWPYQLKFSLHARVTNSMRVSLPKELRRAVEAKRLDETIVGTRAREAAPRLTVVHDPAYLQVPEHDGFSVLLRENRFEGDVSALTVLCQDHPSGGRSRLANLAQGREREWFQAYLQTVIVSLVRLYLDVGLTYEPHQQNTLLRLQDGMPDHALIRDSQGYFHREAAHADICEILPEHGEATESIFPEALADERLVYYPFLNNALGVIDALGAGGGIDERTLLTDLRDTLAAERKAGGRYPHTLLDRLLDDATWPCKANLRTRLHDLDELVGDISTQSVYVTIPNPLTPEIELVPATETFHELLAGWMREPRIARWWGDVDDIGAYLAGLGHVKPWVAFADDVPFAYVETYRVLDDELAGHYEARPDDHGFHLFVGFEDYLGTGVARALVRHVLARFDGRVVCEPDVRNARMLAFCQALGAAVHSEIDLPSKRAALVVWER